MKKELLDELSTKIKWLDKIRDDLINLTPLGEKGYSGHIGRAGLTIPATDEDFTINNIIGDLEYYGDFIVQAIERLKKCSIITPLQNKQKICFGCGVKEGQFHKFGCIMEICPFCGKKLASCSCRYNKLECDLEKVYYNGLSKEEEKKWISILNQKGRIPYILYPEICHRCGKLWPDTFVVTFSDIIKYIEPNMRSKIICKDCFEYIKNIIDKNGLDVT